jgi:seryl-tRNA(Sec) selenium transferase
VAVAHPSLSATKLEACLRRQPIPVIARIDDTRLILDLRTVDPEDDGLVASAFPT